MTSYHPTTFQSLPTTDTLCQSCTRKVHQWLGRADWKPFRVCFLCAESRWLEKRLKRRMN